MPLLRIGIVLFENPRAEVERVGRSLAAGELPPGLEVEARMLDNSPDARLESAVQARFGVNAYSWTGANRGYGATHNLGMREAFATGAAGYLCLNPDALLHPRCLAELWTTASEADTGLVDARTFPEEHPRPYDPVTGDTPWCTGTALLVRPAAFTATGGFDEGLFMYGEDVDLSWRVRAAGLRVRTAPGALVHHWVEHRELSLERELRVLRSAVYLGRKWGNAAFASRYERLYLARAGRPMEPPRPPVVSPVDRRVADLGHGVRFARSRW